VKQCDPTNLEGHNYGGLGPFTPGQKENPVKSVESTYTPDEQVKPIATSGPVIHNLVIDDLRERLRIGIERYGQPLQAHNGRDVLKDIYEELLDAACYVRQLMEERKV
jgi:hypothetical protein